MSKNHKIAAIKRAIENYIKPENNRSGLWVRYPNWYCGVTNNETIRKARHKWEKKIPALYFKSWDAGSKANSTEIESYFHAKGMRGISKSAGGVRSSSKLVYIFKWKTNIADDLAHFFETLE